MSKDYWKKMISRLYRSTPIVQLEPWSKWLLAAALVLVVFLAYQPAWQGGFIWDDDAHVTKPELRSWYGLYRIWFDLGATQQYYPLLHSVFWIEHKLWGDAPLGYHLVSIFLHAMAALMVAAVLRRLEVPGAYLAAAIFALHPVQVESVAWITELKNTLSAVFYLSAAMLYLRFDQERKKPFYAGALLLFALGLLSKTVTATLPAALLVVFWWKRGKLSWRRDVLPLVPFFVLGAAAGLFTAWVERKLIGAEGAEFDLTFIDRFLIAGRVVWFYLGKLFWPAKLIFIYPRWDVNQAVWWQYLFPAAALLLLAALWMLRRRLRGPLAGLLFFVGTLLPVMGFFNVFPFIYSFVADHFQYLASLGVISLVSAGIALLLERLSLWPRIGGYVLCLALLSTLTILTWRQSRMYVDIEMLYQTTIDKNPDCWLAYNNLGLILADTGRLQEAIEHYQQALRLNPDYIEAHNNLGNAFLQTGRMQEAIEHYQQILRLNPDHIEAYVSLGNVFFQTGRMQEAIEHYQEALRLKPDYAKAHNNLGNVFFQTGRLQEAIEHYRQALRLIPDFIQAHNNLGLVLADSGQMQEAIEHLQQALRLKPDYVEAHNNLGRVLVKAGRLQEAIEHYQQALRLNPDYFEAHNNLGAALADAGRPKEAIEHYQQALRLKPDSASAHNNLGNALTNAGRLQEAIEHFRQALQLNPDYAEAHNNLGTALADAGRPQEAIEHYQQALRLNPDYIEAHNNLGAALADAGRLQEAIEQYQQALRLKPGYAYLYFNMALIYARMQQSSDAIAAAQKALELARSQGQTEMAKQIEDWLNASRL
ncbi:MAG: tetratricopeptide repeat protein, partial [Thermoguttaceae bacterium]